MSAKSIIKAVSAQLSDAGWINSTVTVHGEIVTVRGLSADGVERSMASTNPNTIAAQLIALATPQEPV